MIKRSEVPGMSFWDFENLSKDTWIEFKSVLELKTNYEELPDLRVIRCNPLSRVALPHRHYIVKTQNDRPVQGKEHHGAKAKRAMEQWPKGLMYRIGRVRAF